MVKELNDNDLTNVTGGAFIGSLEKEDLENLKAGEMLIWENWLGKDLAKCCYTGQYKNTSSMGANHYVTKNTYLYVTIDTIYENDLKDDEGRSVYPGSSHWIKISELDFLANA